MVIKRKAGKKAKRSFKFTPGKKENKRNSISKKTKLQSNSVILISSGPTKFVFYYRGPL